MQEQWVNITGIYTQGKFLLFKKITHRQHDNFKTRSYRSSSLDCRQCPLRSKCIGKGEFKKIEDTIDKPLYDRMHERLQTPIAKQMKKLRSSTVEPVLGTLTNFLSMRRINTRGIKQANKCMIMAAVAYNLKKLLKWKGTKTQTAVMAMKRQ